MKKLNLQQRKGIYLIIDPSSGPEKEIFRLMEELCRYPLMALQIWDHFRPDQDQIGFIRKICQITRHHPFPVLINNQWEWVAGTGLHGVHFDDLPEDLESIQQKLPENSLLGITCNNDLDFVRKAERKGFDYLSFCSVFPSPTANSCELVSFETIRETHKNCKLPFFLAGGIDLQNLSKLEDIPFSGIAVVSGIMQAENPGKAIENYLKKLEKISRNEINNY
ncbi:thiamine-phosphate pyrophosphorylase [Cyclobacterium lianum]|uniref:Thiamine-phosphate pyrophosphorylase n=1 Tax=Cyclobacterium lianum TaxID=388280 RepID=A0A1M7P1M6_9BACT|nr:thiamine phosphate synthase [Cyclobacterium lianum]SHN10328.1 thiamine-phosphate pyrophosphorylase [Cyclobacterium lianum]